MKIKLKELDKKGRSFYGNFEMLDHILRNPVGMSWGTHEVIRGENYFAFNVNGLRHKGTVIVHLNFSDLFDVFTATKDKPGEYELVETFHDVYFEDLMSIIDRMVEKPKGMTQEEYEFHAGITKYFL